MQTNINQEVRITLYEITKVHNNKPECDMTPFHCTLQRNEQFQILFEKWHKEKQPSRPLRDYEFLYFRRQDDQPNMEMQSGGKQAPLKGAQRLRGDQTPEQLHMPDHVKIYAKREDMNCDMNEEPML